MGTRVLAAVAVLVSAGVHLYLWYDGYKDVDTIGPRVPAQRGRRGGDRGAAARLVRTGSRAFLAVGFGRVDARRPSSSSTTVGLFGLEESWEGW